MSLEQSSKLIGIWIVARLLITVPHCSSNVFRRAVVISKHYEQVSLRQIMQERPKPFPQFVSLWQVVIPRLEV